MSDFYKLIAVGVILAIVVFGFHLNNQSENGRFEIITGAGVYTGYLLDTRTGQTWQLQGRVAYPLDHSVTGTHFVPRPEK